VITTLFVAGHTPWQMSVRERDDGNRGDAGRSASSRRRSSSESRERGCDALAAACWGAAAGSSIVNPGFCSGGFPIPSPRATAVAGVGSAPSSACRRRDPATMASRLKIVDALTRGRVSLERHGTDRNYNLRSMVSGRGGRDDGPWGIAMVSAVS
jgi:hypothetical protein